MLNNKRTTLPCQWDLQGNYLMGITLNHWWSLLQQNQFKVDSAYWYRTCAVTLASCFSTALSQLESWRYARQVEETEITEPPIFILGHWRSGTTLLHELMALDTEQFAYSNTFQVMSPDTFLLTEKLCSRWLARLVPNRRPMDNMAIGFQSPQEDEFAIALTTLQSYYLAFSFPEAQEQYERYLTLETLSQDELERWKQGWIWFLKKLTLKYRRPLVLKSPTHTARIRLLLELFPQARFIHLHRHPYEVFQSMRHYYETAGWLTYLQKPNFQDLSQSVLRRYQILYDAYFEQKSLIPPEQFYEVRFSDLAQDPTTQIQAIYDAFGLSYSDPFADRLSSYVSTRQGYQKNQFLPLDPVTQQKIDFHGQRTFQEWGYEMGKSRTVSVAHAASNNK